MLPETQLICNKGVVLDFFSTHLNFRDERQKIIYRQISFLYDFQHTSTLRIQYCYS
jgi:hypothetical protein